MIEKHTPLAPRAHPPLEENPLSPTHNTLAAEGTDYAQVLCGCYDLRFIRPLSSVGLRDERGEQTRPNDR